MIIKVSYAGTFWIDRSDGYSWFGCGLCCLVRCLSGAKAPARLYQRYFIEGMLLCWPHGDINLARKYRYSPCTGHSWLSTLHFEVDIPSLSKEEIWWRFRGVDSALGR